MAHELTQRSNGFIEFAAAGDRNAVWHRLGQYLTYDASIETWKQEAGMEWEIKSSPLMYSGLNGQPIVDESMRVLYRSDSEHRLGIVSKDYKVVQPGEVLEFFRDLTEANNMKLSAAGTLFGGTKFWATAEIGKEAYISSGDRIDGYLLLMSSADGTSSTIAKLTSTRVVCNNTLQIALNGKSRSAVKITHAKQFDPKSVKIDMGLIDTAWDGFIENIRTLANKTMSDDSARDFFARIITPEEKTVDLELLKTQRHVDAMMHFFKNGAGADMTYGTRWGALNAVTELFTHGNGKRDSSHQFMSSETGTNSSIKMNAMECLLAM